MSSGRLRWCWSSLCNYRGWSNVIRLSLLFGLFNKKIQRTHKRDTLAPDSNGSSHVTPEGRYLEPEHPPAQSKTVKIVIWIIVLAVFAAAFILIERHKSVPAQTAGAAALLVVVVVDAAAEGRGGRSC